MSDVIGPDEGENNILTARGTERGLVLRIDGREEWESILAEVEAFLGGRKKFFDGGVISLEWLDRLPTPEQSRALQDLLRDEYGLELQETKKEDIFPKKKAKVKSQESTTVPLFNQVEEISIAPETNSDFIGAFESYNSIGEEGLSPDGGASYEMSADAVVSIADADIASGKRYINKMSQILGDDIYYEDEANAKVVYGTLRSGQRIETPFNLIVIGDVNPGADLVAGGDIIVFGSLRGTAHASAYDDSALDKAIIAMHMRPMQLRIGSVISRGNDEKVSGAEIARIDNRRIVVEAYDSRSLNFGQISKY